MLKKRREDLEEGGIDYESNPLGFLAGDALSTQDILPTGGYDPYVPFVFDENNVVDDSRTPAEKARARREKRNEETNDGFSESPAATPQAEAKPATLPNGQPKKTTAELINTIKANPTALKLEDIDFSDPSQVDAVVAELKQAMQSGSGEMRYETVLPGDVAGRAPGVYDKTTGQLIQAYGDTSALEEQNAGITSKLASLSNGQSADYLSALAAMQGAQGKVSGGITDADTEAGYGRLDTLMGGNYQGTMDELSGSVGAGITGQEGLSDEEKALYARANDKTLAMETSSAQRTLDSVRASTGSTMAFLASADEVRSKISNLRTQQDVGLLNADMARKEKNYQNKAEQYYGLLEQGRISIQDYEDGLRAERYNAFQATATTLTQIASRDSAEIQNLTQLADVIYAQINAQNAKDKDAYQTWIDRANQQVSPIKNLLDAIMAQDALVTSRA
ncbi:MAG: hypothetical protein ACYC2S_09835 [Spirochaetales bacterium]